MSGYEREMSYDFVSVFFSITHLEQVFSYLFRCIRIYNYHVSIDMYNNIIPFPVGLIYTYRVHMNMNIEQ